MAPPINDDIADAIDVLDGVLKETLAGTIVDATTEADFEDHPSWGANTPIVWYHIAPAVDFRLAVRLTKTGGDAGYLPGADFIHATTYPPADADDLDFVDFIGDGTASPPYQHIFPLLVGEHYYIAAGDYNYDPAQEGTFDLDVQAVPSYLYEDFEDGALDPIIWERRIFGAAPADPNTGVWTVEAVDPAIGTYSILMTPTTQLQQLHHHDELEGGDVSRDYWIAFKFWVDWADVWASDSQRAFLPCITNGNNAAFPHTGTGTIADSFQTWLYATSSSTGEYQDLDGNIWSLTDGEYHELRTRYRKQSGSLIVDQILDGVTIVNNVNVGGYGGTITGVSWRSTFNGGTSGAVRIDPLVWSPDSDPGPLVALDEISAPFIDSTTSVFTPTLDPGNADVPAQFISPATTVFDPYLSGDMDIPAPFIGDTTAVFTPSLLGANRARVTQEPVEAAVLPTSGKARITQVPVEVLYVGDPDARFTQVPVEVAVAQLHESHHVVIIDPSLKSPPD